MKKASGSIFFPNLDALRFFCFLSVFFFHSFATKFTYISSDPKYIFIKRGIFGNGNLGVNFFFVLSGFLISYLLLAEKDTYGKIDIKNFYFRRALKIWPLFYFCVLFGFLIFPILKQAFGQVPAETARPIWYIIFLNNFDFIKHGLPDCSVLGVLWSVAIEEQFYLFWPLIFFSVNNKWLPYVMAAILLFSFSQRLLHYNDPVFLEHHTISCISDMTMGGIGAYFVYFSSRFKKLIHDLPRYVILILYVVVFLTYFYRRQIFNYNSFTIAADRLVVSVIFLFVILEQNFAKNSLFKLGSLKTISGLGKYTYGLYCLHMIGILIVAILLDKFHLNTSVTKVIVWEGGLSLLLSILIAYTSYHLYEKRFLKLKSRFTYIKSGEQAAFEKPEEEKMNRHANETVGISNR